MCNILIIHERHVSVTTQITKQVKAANYVEMTLLWLISV